MRFFRTRPAGAAFTGPAGRRVLVGLIAVGSMAASTVGVASAAPPGHGSTRAAATTATGVPPTMTEAPFAYQPALQLRTLELNYEVVSGGASPLTGYLVRWTDQTASSGSGSFVAGPADGYEIPVGGLTAGDSYTFTMAGVNANGTAAPSPTSNSVRVLDAPGPATDVAAVAGDTTAEVSWKLPTFDGFSPLRFDPIVQVEDLTTATTVADDNAPADTSLRVTNLLNGHSYSFTVTLQNSEDYSYSAPSAPVTPTGTIVGPPAALITGASFPAVIRVGLGYPVVAFTLRLSGPVNLTEYLIDGPDQVARTNGVYPGPGTVHGSAAVEMTAAARFGSNARWVITDLAFDKVLLTRPVLLLQASQLGLRVRRSGSTVSGLGAVKWADHATGTVVPWRGHVVDVQQWSSTGWRTVRVLRADRNGHVTFTITARPKVGLRLVDAGAATISGLASHPAVI